MERETRKQNDGKEDPTNKRKEDPKKKRKEKNSFSFTQKGEREGGGKKIGKKQKKYSISFRNRFQDQQNGSPLFEWHINLDLSCHSGSQK